MNRREFIKSAIAGVVAGALPLTVVANPKRPIVWSGFHLYQDKKCTIPVTEAGQRVGGMVAIKRDNPFALFQGNLENRPTIR